MEKIEFQMSRLGMFWLLFAQLIVAIPHVTRLPIWIIAIGLVCMVWRVMVFVERWRYPSTILKSLIVVLGGISILIHFGGKLTLESAISLLVLGYFLKLIEMYRKRDAYVIAFLSFIIILGDFLYDQEIATTLYHIFSVVVVLAALVSINTKASTKFGFKPVKVAVVVMLQALPLMLVLFVLFPRLPPLWAVSTPQGSAKTGVSDSMSPGDFVNLGKSDALAFRVSFEGDIPPVSEMYWRGMVFSLFDGRTWKRPQNSRFYNEVTDSRAESFILNQEDPSYRYRVLIEPTQQNWLYAMPAVVGRNQGLNVVNGMQYRSTGAIGSQLLYGVESYLDYTLEPELPFIRRKYETLLPAGFNPKTINFARELRSAAATDRAYLHTVLNRFTKEEYYYTLKPPKLGAHSVDDFLFRTKRGFCEHYASSFVVLMRAAGIPARVVVGYQGGEVNVAGNYVLVHQLNAHAWAEVWLRGQGWTRVDPTAAVAPSRIEQGMEEALSEEGSYLEERLFSPLKLKGISYLNNIRLAMDRINLAWNMNVVNYNQSAQSELLRDFLGSISPAKIALVLGGLCIFIVLCLAAVMFSLNRKQRLDRVDRLFSRFRVYMERLGLDMQVGETPLAYSNRIKAVYPGNNEEIKHVADIYVALKYRELDVNKRELLLSRFERAVKRFNYLRYLKRYKYYRKLK